MSIIHANYVDELPWKKIVGDSLRGMVGTLDADSQVLAPRQGGGALPETGASVGLALARRGSVLTVVAAVDGTPARQAGLRAGDLILKIDGVGTIGMFPVDAAHRLGGQPGTQVALSVARSGWPEPRTFTLTRATEAREPITHRLLGDGILYVRIPVMRDTTPWELQHLLESASGRPGKGLVLDLRSTPGTAVASAVAIAGMFLDEGQLVARVQSRSPDQPREMLTHQALGRRGEPMAVLVNAGTAGASEVLAGALQDWHRAVIVGSKTFGDASAQTAIPLREGLTLSLTTARFLTPRGHPITGKGIVPDLSAPGATPDMVADRVGGGTDPEIELAFEVVKAAAIMGRAPGSGPHADPVQAAQRAPAPRSRPDRRPVRS
jgi:carboxyl-terminal processing protease